jgi:hypothetical protein
MQTLIVERIALFTWKIRRLERIEVQILTGELDPNPRIMTEEKRKVWEALQASYRRANGGQVKPPLSPDALYLRSFKDEEQLLDRIQSYVLKLTKAVDASLRELRRLKKGIATEDHSGTGARTARKSEASNGEKEIDQIEPEDARPQERRAPRAHGRGAHATEKETKNTQIEPEKSEVKSPSVAKSALQNAVNRWVKSRYSQPGASMEKPADEKRE